MFKKKKDNTVIVNFKITKRGYEYQVETNYKGDVTIGHAKAIELYVKDMIKEATNGKNRRK